MHDPEALIVPVNIGLSTTRRVALNFISVNIRNCLQVLISLVSCNFLMIISMENTQTLLLLYEFLIFISKNDGIHFYHFVRLMWG